MTVSTKYYWMAKSCPLAPPSDPSPLSPIPFPPLLSRPLPSPLLPSPSLLPSSLHKPWSCTVMSWHCTLTTEHSLSLCPGCLSHLSLTPMLLPRLLWVRAQQGPPHSPALRLQDSESHKMPGQTLPAWHSRKDSSTKGSQQHKIMRDLRDLPAAQ